MFEAKTMLISDIWDTLGHEEPLLDERPDYSRLISENMSAETMHQNILGVVQVGKIKLYFL